MGRAAKRKRQPAHVVLDAYRQAAAHVFAARFTPECCLNGTRVAIEALGEFGIEVVPVTTTVEAYNPIFAARLTARLTATGVWPTSDEMTAWFDEGAWSVGVAPSTRNVGPGFPYHLVGLVGSRLVDSASGQLHRPARGLHVAPITVLTGAGGLLDGPGRLLTVSNAAGCMICYRPVDAPYQYQPGFQRSPQNLQVAREVVRGMRALL